MRSASQSSDAHPRQLLTSLAENRLWLNRAFNNCSDVVFRSLDVGPQGKGLLLFIDGIVDQALISDNLLRQVSSLTAMEKEFQPTVERLQSGAVTMASFSRVSDFATLVSNVLAGHVAMLIDGEAAALTFSVPAAQRRAVEEPATEAAIRGPKEGFVEALRTNTALVRRKIRSPRLKVEERTIGALSRTSVALLYINGVADPEVLSEVRRRLDSISIDGVLESGYIEELIEDQPFSPFPQMQYTERPDTAAAQLLEGRFVILVDGTPFAIMGPVTFFQLLQASEDYYERYPIATLLRWLRYLLVFIALFTPAIYVATITYHQDMLPTNLLLSIAAAREAIPFPALVEALMMEISFEALREAGVRLPKTMGQAVSILGALVIGQAAVEAGIVSAPMVIIVSLTGIASFAIPRFNGAIAIRMLRFPMMVLAGTLGLFGLVIGTVWMVTHLVQLRSFGSPYLAGWAPLRPRNLKDILGRAPWWMMRTRPVAIARQNRVRVPQGMRPAPPEGKG